MATMNSGRDKTPEEREHDDDIEQPDDELQDSEEETIITIQQGHIPGRLPEGWDVEITPVPGVKEVSLDHATDDEWQDFLDSLKEE